MEECIISDCKAEGFGGGLRILGGQLTLVQSHIYRNQAVQAVSDSPSFEPCLVHSAPPELCSTLL